MANTYTQDDITLSDKIFFLNGNNLTHDIDKDGAVNPIPSLKLVKDISGAVDSKFQSISGDISVLSGNYLQKADFDKTLSGSFTASDFRYDTDEHKFHLNVKGNDLTIPMADIFKGQMIKKIEVYTDTSGIKYLQITFNDEQSSTISIKVQDLAQIYKAGYGIDISENLSVSVRKDIALSTSNVQGLSELLENRVSQISGVYDEVTTGIISKITQTDGKLTLERRKVISTDFQDAYEGGTHSQIPMTYVAGLAEKIGDLVETDWRALKFNGHISKASEISDCNYLSDVFRYHKIQDIDDVFNGTFIHVNFTDAISAKLICCDTIFENGDYLIIHDHDSHKRTVDVSSISFDTNAFMIRKGTQYSHPTLTGELSDGTDVKFYKTGFDRFGHISVVAVVTSSDIDELVSDVYLKKDEAYEHPVLTGDLSDGVSEGLYRTGFDRCGHLSSKSSIVSSDLTPVLSDVYLEKSEKYIHPSTTSVAEGFYKVGFDALGHVSSTTSVTSGDITSLVDGEYHKSSESFLTANALDNLSGNWDAAYGRVSALTANLLSDTIALSSTEQVKTLIRENSSKTQLRDDISGDGEFHDVNLSVHKLPLSSYMSQLVSGEVNASCLYITDSDYIDAFDQEICCVVLCADGTDYKGRAATDAYVNAKCGNIRSDLSAWATDISNKIFVQKSNDAVTFGDILNALSTLCEKLVNL